MKSCQFPPKYPHEMPHSSHVAMRYGLSSSVNVLHLLFLCCMQTMLQGNLAPGNPMLWCGVPEASVQKIYKVERLRLKIDYLLPVNFDLFTLHIILFAVVRF